MYDIRNISKNHNRGDMAMGKQHKITSYEPAGSDPNSPGNSTFRFGDKFITSGPAKDPKGDKFVSGGQDKGAHVSGLLDKGGKVIKTSSKK